MPSAFYLPKTLKDSWLFLYKKILLQKIRLKERVDLNLASTALPIAPRRLDTPGSQYITAGMVWSL